MATPVENLDCAAWSALVGGEAKSADDSTGAAAMLAWYIASTKRPLERRSTTR